MSQDSGDLVSSASIISMWGHQLQIDGLSVDVWLVSCASLLSYTQEMSSIEVEVGSIGILKSLQVDMRF